MRYFSLVTILIVMVALVGCTASATQVDRVAPSTILADTSPAQLDLMVHLTLGNDVTMPHQSQLTIIVSHQDKLVQFTRDEQMTCNGLTLGRFMGSFEEEVAVANLAGLPLRCTYTSGQTSAMLTATVPTLPIILAPQNGATVPRGAQTLIRYAALAYPFHLGAFGPTSKAFPSDALQGPTQTLLDTRPLTVGSGTIALTEDVTPFLLQGTAFHTVGGDAQASATILVTWT